MIIRFSIYFLTFSLSSFALAQDNVGEQSTVVYNSDYFDQWSPVTAQDMIDRIPGLTQGGSSRGGFGGSGGFSGGGFSGFRGGSRGGRGFGNGNRGSEILINGKRTAGKNNSTGTQLARITFDQVDYIEIIRGTSGELDVRGSGQVVNVVLTDVFSDVPFSTRFLDSSLKITQLLPELTFLSAAREVAWIIKYKAGLGKVEM